MSFFLWSHVANWHKCLFYGWKGGRNSRLFAWRQWSFQLDFSCQNYSVITVYVRFPIWTGQEGHINVERSESNLTHLSSWSVKLGCHLKKCWLPQQNNQAKVRKDKGNRKHLRSNTFFSNGWSSRKKKKIVLALTILPHRWSEKWKSQCETTGREKC